MNFDVKTYFLTSSFTIMLLIAAIRTCIKKSSFQEEAQHASSKRWMLVKNSPTVYEKPLFDI
jgi:hypothetical protein